MIDIFSDEKIESFPKALNNKAYYCYKNNYSAVSGQSFYDYSLSLLSKAIAVDNVSYKSYMLMGEIYFKTHKYESSLNSYRQALNISQNINSLNNTAVMFRYLGENEKAEALLKKASEISDSSIVWYNYALECAFNHKSAEVKNAFENNN